MAQLLKVGKKYQLTTKNETLNGIKVMVVGIIAFSEARRVQYDLATLALNERIISYKDESNLELYLKDDNIYHLRSTEKNLDGTYAEFLVWDSIIDINRTTNIDSLYTFELNINVKTDIGQSINIITADIINYLKTRYKHIDASIVHIPNNDEASCVLKKEQKRELQLDKALSIIDSLNKLDDELLPVARVIIDSNIKENLKEVIVQINELSGKISLFSKL